MALERVADAGWEPQIERRRPGRLPNPAGETRMLIRYYSVLLRATDIGLEELAGSPPEVLGIIQEYRGQFRAQVQHWSRVLERDGRGKSAGGQDSAGATAAQLLRQD